MVGVGTVLQDDPALTVRDPRFADARQPLRVVVDASGRTTADRQLFGDAAPTLVATTDRAPEERLRAWQEAGAEIVILERDAVGRVDLVQLLQHLGKRDVQGVLVEGGATLAWSFVRDGLVDRVVLYLAPTILGGASAPGVVMGDGFTPVGEGLRVAFERADRVGPDLRVEADVHRDH